MKKGGWIWIWILACLYSNSWSQKKWDGEGNDSLWNNAKNWYPDGLPQSTDSVVIDNSIFQKDIFIWVTDTTSIVVHALTIQPSNSLRITLEIPTNNSQNPALSLLSKGNSISIYPNGTFINQSGASSGNPIVLAGKFWIGNQGKYIHRTLRGNASLIAALSAGPSNSKSIFEFDVPGSAGYTISISGRQFGTLVLNSTRTPKKTYNGSGVGNLTLWGDLTIGDSATFNSTLNGNILLNGNFEVSGKCNLTPSQLDTAQGRQIQILGDTATIHIKGTLTMGDNFRNMVIERGRITLLSGLTFPKSTQSLIIRKNTTLDLASFKLTGWGKLKTENTASIRISGLIAMDSANSNASIQLKVQDIDPGTSFCFYGDSSQQTGRDFPARIANLTIEKSNHHLTLSKSLEITDILLLKQGNLNSTEVNQLYFKGNHMMGNDSSFIDGPVHVYWKEKKNYLVPLGDSSVYAPMRVHRNSTDSSKFQLEYKRSKLEQADSSKLYPLVGINHQGYWLVNPYHANNSEVVIDSLLFYVKHLNPFTLKGQPVMARYDTSEKKWIGLPSAPIDSNGLFLKIVPQQLKTGIYVLGELQIDALPKYKIELIRKKINNHLTLQWFVGEDIQFDFYTLERSKDGIKFQQIDSLPSQKNNKGNTYASKTIADTIERYLYRVKGRQTDGKVIYSNVVFISPNFQAIVSYPNPVQNELRIEGLTEKIKSIKIIFIGVGSNQTVPWKQDSERTIIDVTGIPQGIVELFLSTETGRSYRTRIIKVN